jgi:hypothetical protein
MGRNRPSPVPLIVGLSLILTACGTMGNTLAQDLAYERFQSCRYVTNNVFLDRIDADGRVWIHMDNGTAGYQEWRACMAKAAQDQASARTGGAPAAPAAGGSVTTPPSPVTATASAAALPESIAAPSWIPGEEWAYRWETPSGKGTYIASVARKESVDGVEHVVVKEGSRELYYRAVDGMLTLQKTSGEISRRYAPGWETVSFPLSIGKRWDTRFTDEMVTDRTSTEIARTCLAEAQETITVPAGTFTTIDILCKNARTDQVVYRLWYSPLVKQMVKRVWHVSGGLDTRELIAYKLR